MKILSIRVQYILPHQDKDIAYSSCFFYFIKVDLTPFNRFIALFYHKFRRIDIKMELDISPSSNMEIYTS